MNLEEIKQITTNNIKQLKLELQKKKQILEKIESEIKNIKIQIKIISYFNDANEKTVKKYLKKN